MNIDEMAEHASDAAGLMKALGNESRLMILCMLADQECSVGELNETIPLSQSALSQQLARLRQQSTLAAELLRDEKLHLMPPDYNPGVWGAVHLAGQAVSETATHLLANYR